MRESEFRRLVKRHLRNTGVGFFLLHRADVYDGGSCGDRTLRPDALSNVVRLLEFTAATDAGLASRCMDAAAALQQET